MKNKNDISNLKENESSFLNQLNKKNDFSVPKDYFEVLPEIINNKTLVNSKMRFKFDILSYRFLIPTSAILLLLFFVFNWNKNIEQKPISNEQLSEILIESDYIEFEDEILYEAYSETIYNEDLTAEEKNEYVNYLLENDIELNTIIEEL